MQTQIENPAVWSLKGREQLAGVARANGSADAANIAYANDKNRLQIKALKA